MAKQFLSVRSGIALKPGSAPSDPANGDIYYDISTNQLMAYINGAWLALFTASVRAGSVAVSSAVQTATITFSSPLANTNYAISVNMRNTTDTNPQYQPVVISAKSTTGVTVKWNANTDSANYFLEYTVIANT